MSCDPIVVFGPTFMETSRWAGDHIKAGERMPLVVWTGKDLHCIAGSRGRCFIFLPGYEYPPQEEYRFRHNTVIDLRNT